MLVKWRKSEQVTDFSVPCLRFRGVGEESRERGGTLNGTNCVLTRTSMYKKLWLVWFWVINSPTPCVCIFKAFEDTPSPLPAEIFILHCGGRWDSSSHWASAASGSGFRNAVFRWGLCRHLRHPAGSHLPSRQSKYCRHRLPWGLDTDGRAGLCGSASKLGEEQKFSRESSCGRRACWKAWEGLQTGDVCSGQGFSGQFFIELYFYRTLFQFTVSLWFGGNIYLKTLASGITILKKKRKPYHQCCCKPEFLFGPRSSVTF